MRNAWQNFVVRYWNHDKRINDCFGNSVSWVGKARTINEARNKAEKAAKNSTKWQGGEFRICSIKFAE